MKRIIFVLLLFLCLISVLISNKQKIYDLSFREDNNHIININKYNEYAKPQSIISVKQLKTLIENENVKLIALKEDINYTEYIPNSQILNIDDVSQTINNIKGFVPSKEKVEEFLSNFGIDQEDTIVLYDNFNNVLSARLWFILTLYGHRDVKVLDGGITAWINNDYYVVNKIETPEKTKYLADEKQNDKIADIELVKNSLYNENYLFLDVRSNEEYKKGHIPHAINIPFTETLNKDKTIKTYDELKMIYVSKEVNPNKKNIIVYCSFGNRATYTYYVLTQLLGYKNVLLYDGSYAEYSVSGLPIEREI
ncbi:MAG: sulfurtransferase [Haloplasmataceae bacterium]|nr:sulfurtransferase [Haloplasmataceae bacterium]